MRRVAVAGASGRMGRMLIEAVLASGDCTLSAAIARPGSASIGTDAGAFLGQDCGVRITADLSGALRSADVLIDFTRPDGSLQHVAACRAAGVQLVIGTTGFDEAGRAAIGAAARDVAIVMSPNMSIGVNVVLQLLAAAATSLGDGYDIEITEAHHRHKVDAPSGTALRMGEVIADAQGRALTDCAATTRDGKRQPGSIGFASVRGGDIVGDHTVLFAGTGERIEITHKSSSRATYAEGSLRAVRFLRGQTRGLFGMDAVLGLPVRG